MKFTRIHSCAYCSFRWTVPYEGAGNVDCDDDVIVGPDDCRFCSHFAVLFNRPFSISEVVSALDALPLSD